MDEAGGHPPAFTHHDWTELRITVGDPDHRRREWYRDPLDAFHQPVSGHQIGTGGALGQRHLHHRAQFFVEQRAQRARLG
ncbi:hypothetical protein SAMN02745204_00973 [Thermomonas hydrothermalis]|uniref:Uncharacterized protein n=1 Tax=Thermomonas hydrothermalis TaxID=213588 RepID=A0A1M4VP31_9GAMM|nr:hypothetical protein SAMN02745204_00973 [Thermomonas hydrothermalis]